MFDKIFQIVQAIDNSQGLKVLEKMIQSLSYVVTVFNADEMKSRKNELIDDLIKLLESHKDKVQQQPETSVEVSNG